MNEEDPISTAVGTIVNAGELAGAATLVWRDGKVIQAAGVGWRDKDTGFTVPQEKRGRLAGMYGFDEAGRLVKRLTATGRSTLPERPVDMAYVSGGAGLWSTLDDYLAFARMFVGAGAVDGLRLLRPE